MTLLKLINILPSLNVFELEKIPAEMAVRLKGHTCLNIRVSEAFTALKLDLLVFLDGPFASRDVEEVDDLNLFG